MEIYFKRLYLAGGQSESHVKFFENSFPFEGKWSILNK